MRRALTLCFVTLLGACGYNKTTIPNTVEAAHYDPEHMARVRIFSSPELQAFYQPGASCEQVRYRKKDDALIATKVYAGNEHHILGRQVDLKGMKAEDYQNRAIGIPASEATNRLAHDRIGYDEFVLPAGKPSVVMINYWFRDPQNPSWCSPAPVVLEPKAGKDYEVEFSFVSTGFMSASCRLDVRELIGNAPIRQGQEVKTNHCVRNEQYNYDTVAH